MGPHMKSFIIVLVYFACLFGDDYKIGLEAYEKKDYNKAIAYFTKACNSGNDDACLKIHEYYRDNHKDQTKEEESYKKARAIWTKKCNSGNADSCKTVGYYDNDNGDHAKADEFYEKAKAIWIKACNSGNAEGCNELGEFYDDGREDGSKAIEYYSKACSMGNASSCSSIANMYQFARGVKVNLMLAKEYHTKGCKLDKSFCGDLEVILNVQDCAEAFKLFDISEQALVENNTKIENCDALTRSLNEDASSLKEDYENEDDSLGTVRVWLDLHGSIVKDQYYYDSLRRYNHRVKEQKKLAKKFNKKIDRLNNHVSTCQQLSSVGEKLATENQIRIDIANEKCENIDVDDSIYTYYCSNDKNNKFCLHYGQYRK